VIDFKPQPSTRAIRCQCGLAARAANRAASSSPSAPITFSCASSSGCALADCAPDLGNACDHPAVAVACVFLDDRQSQRLAHRIRHGTFGGPGLEAGKRLSRRDLASRAVVVRQIGLIPTHADTARDDPLRKSRSKRTGTAAAAHNEHKHDQTSSYALSTESLDLLPAQADEAPHAAAFVDGYQIGLNTSAAVMTAGALLALITLRRDPAEAEPLVVAPERA
jgi:hypothetical protein